MPRRTDIFSKFPSHQWGEGGARSASGEGARRWKFKRRCPSPNPLPAGERALTRVSIEGDEQFVTDGFQDSFGVRQHVMVPEADDAIAESFNHLRSRGIRALVVLPAIKLDRQSRLAAGEVGDVRTDLFLADELGAFELARAEMPPEALFGVGLIAPEFPGDGGSVSFPSTPFPLTPTLSPRGRGSQMDHLLDA